MKATSIGAALWLMAFALAGPAAAQQPARPLPPATFDSATISGLGARNIGSAAMSGRIAAIAARRSEGRTTIFVGAASGGVWRSEDDGTTFKPVFDHQSVQSIGAIAIDPRNPKTIWVGTGESWTRNSVSIGDGIYKSTDGGETWTNMGLPNSERITKILVVPGDGLTVYACVPGKLWSDSPDRGLYKTTDGGTTWSLVLKGTNLSTGCASVALDPRDPNRVLASLWDFRRRGWSFRSGGESANAPSGSGLFVSTDAGGRWTEVTPETHTGIPGKPYGRIAVAIAPSDPSIAYAVVEGTASALYRSGDGGRTWEKRNTSQMLVWRPFYFSNLIVDPSNPNRLFKPDLNLVVSLDGGTTFSYTGGGLHGDWHDVWIDPENPNHLIGGSDGGLGISHDGGNRWDMAYNLPVSQFYHVSVDQADPYHVYGGLQDNSSWVGPSSYPGGIGNSRWENMYGGDGFWMFPDPSDPDYLYAEAQGGEIGRVNRNTLESRSIKPTERYKEKLRWNWNTPIHISPNADGTIYIGAQFLFRSSDHGESWQRISPDLTTNDPEKQKQEESGGITVDNSSAETHTTIYSISESPKNRNVIWVGTDDGNVQLTRDGGTTWTNVVAKVTGLPPNAWVSWVEASRHDPATAYAAFDRHTFGDMAPHAFVTRDYGATWSRIASADQGVRGYAHVIKEDTENPNLLFLGTELGLWISNDAGTHWAEFKGSGFPSVAVRDLVVQDRDSDLVIATHGRGIWIVDDITPLRALTPDLMKQDAAFVPIRPVQQRLRASGGWAEGDATFVAPGAPDTAQITYYLRSRHLFGPMRLEILDPKGQVIETLPAGKHRGLNRVSWNMRVKPPTVPPAAQLAYSASAGPRIVPGPFSARLTKGTATIETKLPIVLDRRATFTIADRQANFDASMRVHALFGRMADLASRIAALQRGAAGAQEALPESDPLRSSLATLATKAESIRKQIVATKEGGAITGEERLREHTDNLYYAMLSYEGRPAGYLLERTEALEHELKDLEGAFDVLLRTDLEPLKPALTKHKLGPLVPPSTKSTKPERPQ